MSDELLRVEDVVKHFGPRRERVRAVDGVSLELAEGQTLGLVGESGCGKSTLGRLVTRLLAPTSGRIHYRGTDIARLAERRLRPFRGDIQMVFQDPYLSLNPRHTVGAIIGAAVARSGERETRTRVGELLEVVGLDADHVDRYPHEFSGGQRQRVGIARALATRPRLIVADEPVSALDVSIQAQIMNLLQDLRREFGIAVLFVAHDLGVVRYFCDRVTVMYLGKVVETGTAQEIYTRPRHPYTQALLSAAPDLSVVRTGTPRPRIRLTGDVPSPVDPPSGCRFRTRCWKADDLCAAEEPALSGTDEHVAACHHA
ncbi:ABC transporter ATP-binding protein [Actinokineospora sp. UTMC 2448]|uniref:ABC transporter ATP-binding protein n=1 Tax=Actinokineospora sp. UTMC 2448 TaxID=2268449 RepID=UPI00216478A8|nr:oligopeptide/dipeptide ABC transporter ATP-binding protein [Actinokineospora sp. UTMC 2448]UVS79095.1 Stage 0 sporulation protein KE [Actinokineospora sp. UTMC 2448]